MMSNDFASGLKWGGIFGILFGVLLTISLGSEGPSQEDVIKSYEDGKRAALRMNPPSMDLEMACVSMWANKQ